MENERDKGKRVNALVVDEDEETRQILMESLQEAGYFTDMAHNGKEALDKVKEFFYNIAVVEVELADMTGLEFLKMIKSIHPDTSVIFMTGKPSLENSVGALNAGANASMLKPFKVEEMMEHVIEALNRQRAIIETRELLFAERKKREFYQYLSIIDGLTDLYNHRHFHELLTQEVARAQRYEHPLSLLMIDIDDFKRFNDSFGHPAGDKALQEIAKLFRENCRRVDYICRYGGEEFGIITPETSGKNVVHLARRLVNKVRELKIQIYESTIEEGLTISMGLAGYPSDAKTKNDLIIKADKYLLEAKKAGKNCFFPPSPHNP
jgi:two-component system cell cycle response regulator